ncbi:hypothetical protein RF11_05572 [Thelohanellus kitauei]|uniref:Uncharacterized protein n=1 Tax=Thelohanellus kitauei TaxID=669202 RepID=A0A0C2M808_THEKT|nr:hypothetical protein RF11_05572 [Thelohanellus kitauei]
MAELITQGEGSKEIRSHECYNKAVDFYFDKCNQINLFRGKQTNRSTECRKPGLFENLSRSEKICDVNTTAKIFVLSAHSMSRKSKKIRLNKFVKHAKQPFIMQCN